MSMKKGRIGSAFEDFLKSEGVHEETMAIAKNRFLAWQSNQAMAGKRSNQNRIEKTVPRD